MPRNSTGNYTLPLPPVVAGELIEAPWANTSLDDIGQALTDSLDRYGRGGMLAPFLFADGTLANPGAAWANAPGTGFYRDNAHVGFVWNSAEIVSFNANGLTGKVGALNAYGDFTFMFGDTETASRFIKSYTPDGFGRAAIEFEHVANGAGSDSYINFFTNSFGVDRDVRVSIKPTGELVTFKGIDIPTDAPNGINFKANASALYTLGDSTGFYLPDNVEFQLSGTAGRVFTVKWNGDVSVVRSVSMVPGQGLFWTDGATPYWNLGADSSSFYVWDDLNNIYALTIAIGSSDLTSKGRGTFRDWVGGLTSDGARYGRVGVPNENGWPGVMFYWAGFAERQMGMTQTGDVLFWSGASSTGNVKQAFQANGDIRAVRFVATPTPG